MGRKPSDTQGKLQAENLLEATYDNFWHKHTKEQTTYKKQKTLLDSTSSLQR